MHVIIVALHHPKTFQSPLKSIQDQSTQDKLESKTPKYELYQLEGDFKCNKIKASEELSRFIQNIVNKYQEGEIKNVTILTDFNLGFSSTLSSPIPLLDKYINTEFTDIHKQRFQTQNKNTPSSAASSSAQAPSLIPVNFYFAGSGTTADPDSGMPQHTVKEIMDLYGTGRGDVTSFLRVSRPPSARPGSRSSIHSPSLGGTSSPNLNSRDQTPQLTIRKHSSADDEANVPYFPQLPSSLATLSDSDIPRAASASASSVGSSHFPRDSSTSYEVYEEYTPSASATPGSIGALSAAFLSPNSYRADDGDEDELAAVTEEVTEEISAAALAGLVPTTPVNRRPEPSIVGFLTFNKEINAKSPVVSPAPSPLKTRPGLFGTRSCCTTPVPSPIKSDTPSPQRPALTVKVDETADVDRSLNQLKF